jgi:DNA-binding XRE family transcriptional regulator
LPFCHGCIVAPLPPQPKRWICRQSVPNELLTIGDHIKARRITLHLFQNDVAKQIGVHRASVQNWERNVGVPMPGQIPAVLRFLGYIPFPQPASRGGMLRDVRICCGWTQGEFAKAAGCGESTVARWENDQRPDGRKFRSAIAALRHRLNGLKIADKVSHLFPLFFNPAHRSF